MQWELCSKHGAWFGLFFPLNALVPHHEQRRRPFLFSTYSTDTDTCGIGYWSRVWTDILEVAVVVIGECISSQPGLLIDWTSQPVLYGVVAIFLQLTSRRVDTISNCQHWTSGHAYSSCWVH